MFYLDTAKSAKVQGPGLQSYESGVGPTTMFVGMILGISAQALEMWRQVADLIERE
jgi:hypothetical protein